MMRLLEFNTDGELSLTIISADKIPQKYAILSHTWEAEEVTYEDLQNGTGMKKAGYQKIRFCGEQARRDGLEYFWVDTCCIDKSSSAELTEAINSMFRWYFKSTKCYVYLSDVLRNAVNTDDLAWESAFRNSRWFTRGWTLQEFLAPKSVEFFSKEGKWLGSKESLKGLLCDITGVTIEALEDKKKYWDQFGLFERLQWTVNRQTTIPEDQAYCLLGLFGVQIPLIYGEGVVNASVRLGEEINRRCYIEDTEPLLEIADFGAPKRALPAYFYFANENRDKLRDNNPGITPGAIGVLLGEKWNTFGDHEKRPYEDIAKIINEENERHMGRTVAGIVYRAAMKTRRD